MLSAEGGLIMLTPGVRHPASVFLNIPPFPKNRRKNAPLKDRDSTYQYFDRLPSAVNGNNLTMLSAAGGLIMLAPASGVRRPYSKHFAISPFSLFALSPH